MKATDPLAPTAMQPMMTVPEVAVVIQKSAFTVRKLARLHALPGAKRIGKEWRFQRPAIEKYATGGR